MSQINANFHQTAGGRAAIDGATYLHRPWVANAAIGNAMRALAHELFTQDPSADHVAFDTAGQAEAVYALVRQATTEAENTQHKGSLTKEGLPVGADGLTRLMRAGSFDKFWVKAVDFAQAQNLAFEDDPKSKYISSSIGPKFAERMQRLVTNDADAALAASPELAAKATQAEGQVESKFLRGGRQLRHGGVFQTPSRKLSDLSPAELGRLDIAKQGARIGAAFGFGQVFGNNANRNRHGAGWGRL